MVAPEPHGTECTLSQSARHHTGRQCPVEEAVALGPSPNLGGPADQRNLGSAAPVRLELPELLRIDGGPGPGAVLVEGLPQGRGHLIVRHLLKIGALEHEDLPAILEEAHRGRGGRISGHVLPGPVHRVAIDTREDSDVAVGNHRVLEGEHHPRASAPRRAAGDGGPDHEDRARRRSQDRLHLLGGRQRLDADRGQLLPHGCDRFRIVDRCQGHWLSSWELTDAKWNLSSFGRRQPRAITDDYFSQKPLDPRSMEVMHEARELLPVIRWSWKGQSVTPDG